MSLAPGTRLGPYEIIEPIGSGGMGDVYRARDANLHRDVALKILPPLFAGDPARLARLRREAQVLASLSHPNIAGIYGFEEANGISALVLELVDGPTLAERVARGPVPIDDAIAIARQIADAMAAAHERGVIHRDLKPANIKVRPDGTVKILDFGLAKALDAAAEPDASDAAPTLARQAAMTRDGVVLGTPAYMSPEQTRGRPLDRRSDVWAFGCVFYEMLTGRSAFARDTPSDAIAAILERDPDWQALPPSAIGLERVLRRCLEKDVKRRLRDVGDVTLWLDDAGARGPAGAPSVRSARTAWIAAAVLGVIAGGAAVALLSTTRTGSSVPHAARFELKTSEPDPFTVDSPGMNVAIAPDGSRLVYSVTRGGVPGLVSRRLDQMDATPIAGAEGGVDPFFSPDGREIAFATISALKRVPVEGGAAVTICPVDPTFAGATWGRDGVIVFAQGRALFRVPVSGGEPQRLADPDAARGEGSYRHPSFLPGGRALLYTVLLAGVQTRIDARRLDGGAATTILEGGFGPQYLPSGDLVYAQGDRAMAIRFDATSLRATGPPVTVQKGVFTKASEGVSNVAGAADGTMVFVAGINTGGFARPVWVDRRGTHVAPIGDQPLEGARNLRISPDGRRLALTVGPDGQGQIWIFDLTGSAQPVKLTFHDHNTFAIWSKDGKRIVFMSLVGSSSRAYSLPADGSAVQPDRLPLDLNAVPQDWSPDGELLFLTSAWLQMKLGLVPAGGGKARQWLETPFQEFGGRFSPDGRWLAYASNQTGATEIWVRPFPGPGAPVRVSADGGHDPVWARDGKELFFINGPKLLAARVTSASPDFRVGAPATLFSGGFVHDDADLVIRYFDSAPDGRLIMIEPVSTVSAGIVVAQRWREQPR